MTRKLIITNDDGREFEHGELEVIKRQDIEKHIKAKIDLWITEDVDQFQEELEELIKRYAI